MTELWAARIIDDKKNSYFFSGQYGGFVTLKKDMATFAFTEDQASELGGVMLKFLEYAISGKLTNSPIKRKR